MEIEIGSIFVIVGTAKSGILPHIQIMYYPDTSEPDITNNALY